MLYDLAIDLSEFMKLWEYHQPCAAYLASTVRDSWRFEDMVH